MNGMAFVDFAFFGVCTLLMLVGGVITVAARNPIRGAMGLMATIVGVAGMYLLLSAELLAAVQIIVYAGAVVVLFLFVIMLLGPSSMAPRDKRGAFGRTVGGTLFGLSVLAALFLVARLGGMHGARLHNLTATFGGIDDFGRVLFSDGIVPFELSSALLMVAVVGAVAVARGKQGEEAHIPPSGQPGLAAKSPAAGAFADVRATRMEGHGHQ
jgi:NADH-quinone oxidoreductase subunit J